MACFACLPLVYPIPGVFPILRIGTFFGCGCIAVTHSVISIYVGVEVTFLISKLMGGLRELVYRLKYFPQGAPPSGQLYKILSLLFNR